jgi:hypothetical protein
MPWLQYAREEHSSRQWSQPKHDIEEDRWSTSCFHPRQSLFNNNNILNDNILNNNILTINDNNKARIESIDQGEEAVGAVSE